MLDILRAIPGYVIIPLGALAAALVGFLVFKSFREGREISFWPPRIGPRPAATPVQPPAVPTPAALRPPVAPPPAARAPAPAPAPAAPEGGPGVPRFREPRRESLKALETIRPPTDHSLIRKCTVDEASYVLKATQARFCDLPALERLAAHAWEPGLLGTFPPKRTERFATAAIPYMAWEEEGFVWELQEHVDGVPLGEVVLKNGRGVGDAVLLDVVRRLSSLMGELNQLKVVHRDITPFNLLVTRSGDLRLIDWSYCLRAGPTEIPVGTPGYASPEQQLAGGALGCEADWYGFGATLFFLVNGYAPFERGTALFEAGLENVRTGQWRPRFELGTWGEVTRGLLHQEPAKRLEPFAVHLVPDSGEMLEQVTNILDLGVLGYLVATRNRWHVLDSPSAPEAETLRGPLQAVADKGKALAGEARTVLEWLGGGPG